MNKTLLKILAATQLIPAIGLLFFAVFLTTFPSLISDYNKWWLFESDLAYLLIGSYGSSLLFFSYAWGLWNSKKYAWRGVFVFSFAYLFAPPFFLVSLFNWTVLALTYKAVMKKEILQSKAQP